MKFLDRVVKEYAKLNSDQPQWVKEYVAPISPITSPTVTTPTAATTSKPTSLGKAIDDTLKVEMDPELAKKKEELDTVYKQVADVLKKKAAETTNKLKQTSTDITATPSTTTPTVPVV